MKVVKENEVLVVSEEVKKDLSSGQKVRWELLRGKKLKVGKVKRGKGLICCICGRRSKVENSVFVEVVEGGGGKGLLSSGCCVKYYGKGIEEKGGGKGYKIYI